MEVQAKSSSSEGLKGRQAVNRTVVHPLDSRNVDFYEANVAANRPVRHGRFGI